MDGRSQLLAIREHAEDLLTAWAAYLSDRGATTESMRWEAVYVWLVQPCEDDCAQLREMLSDWQGAYLPLSHPHTRHILSTEYVLRDGDPAERRLADVIARVLRATGIDPRPHYVRVTGAWEKRERPQTIAGDTP